MNMKLKAGFALAVVAALSGCQTPNINANHDFQGKVWRSEVYGGMSASMSITEDENPKANITEFVKRTGYAPAIVEGMRMAPVRFRSTDWGGTWHWLKATVPDSMPTADVKKGAIVDVLVERYLDINYPSYRINRIVRLVCKADDADCIERIKKEKSLNTVVEANPVPGQHYGNTYTYKLTQAEAEAYNKSLKR